MKCYVTLNKNARAHNIVNMLIVDRFVDVGDQCRVLVHGMHMSAV